jgi:glyoxylase-like metal-dependent hydrolase (beta-lactamase superfamily II)
MVANRPFTQGIHDLGNGLYGYVQPDGTWGWSNAGLVVSAGKTLLIDTLMSVPLTRRMLDAFARNVAGGDSIDTVVNTHANPDHFFGNGLVAQAEIIATRATKEDMAAFNPKMLAGLAANYQQMGDSGEFLYETMGCKFDFSGVETLTLPNRTFEKRLSLPVGDKAVELIDLGPAHTVSDVLVWVPGDRTVFTGDLIFNEGHPIMWAGPVENWIAACRYIVELDPAVVVPGHGPITGIEAVRGLQAYFEYVRDEARKRFEAGMDFEAAARDINMAEYRGWSDPERIVANVFSLYRQWGASFTAEQQRDLFGAMGRYHRDLTQHRNGSSHGH